MKNKGSPILLALTALTLVLASGCSAPEPAGLTDEQVGGVAENVLKALDADDFEQFSKDLSDPMKKAFGQEKFASLRTMLLNASGQYVSLGKPALTNNQGYAVYRFPAKYKLETVYVTLTFLIGGQKVEGFFLDSTNLRELPVNK